MTTSKRDGSEMCISKNTWPLPGFRWNVYLAGPGTIVAKGWARTFLDATDAAELHWTSR